MSFKLPRTAICLTTFLLAGCGDLKPSTRQAEVFVPGSSGKLIARRVLFGNPDRANPQLSPDGKRLAFLAPRDGVMNVWVGPADNPAAARPVTKDTHRGIRRYFWAYTSDHVLYLQDTDGDENWHVYAVDLATHHVRDLTPFEKIAARVAHVSHRFPDEILVGINDRDPRWHDLHRVNIRTGQRKLLQQNDGFLAFLADDDYNVHLATRLTPDGGGEILKRADDGRWLPFIQYGSEDSLTTQPIGFDKSGRTLFLIDSRGRNTAALASLDLSGPADPTVLARDDHADVHDVITHPTENHVQAAASTYARKHWQVLDPAIQPDLDYLRTVADGDIEILSRTLADDQWIVSYLLDNGPTRFYRYNRAARKANFLFTDRSDLKEVPLARMHPVVIRARDGLELVSYLTLPCDADPDENGRPDQPLPMVLFVHGGPWARDYWGLKPYHQWLADRGYAVLSVNFRGSTGFGKNFLNAGNRQWAAAMHDDLVDAVEWAVASRVANRARVAIMGGSYGGYATLAGLTFTPDLFACGVDIVGPSNLVTLLNSIPPYWAPMIDLFTSRVGDHRTDEGRSFLAQRSPLTYVDRIRRPLLIGQGANDPRVKQAESDQIVAAMRQRHIPVTYVLYSDEGHGFARPENALSFNAIAEAFLARHLGGRYQPISDDFRGSSLAVPTGASDVPGLEGAMAGKG